MARDCGFFVFVFFRPADALVVSEPGGGQSNLATHTMAQACMLCLFHFFFVTHVLLFSLSWRFQVGNPPPSRDCGLCLLSISCWFCPLASPPGYDGSLREDFDVGFRCLRPCVLLQFDFLRLAPATLTV